MSTLLAFWAPSGMEIIVALVVGLVLFGGSLPEVGRSVGKSLIEFRKGLKDLKTSAGLDEVNKVKEEMMNMARDVDPRHMMDVEDEHLPDDPYKDVYQEGEYNEVESSKAALEAPEGSDDSDAGEESGGDSPVAEAGEDVELREGADPESVTSPEEATSGRENESRLEGSHREPHEEDDPPTFGYDRHG